MTASPVGEGAKQKRRNRLTKEMYENMSSVEQEQRKKENARIASQEFRKRRKQLNEQYSREYEQLKKENGEKQQILANLNKLKAWYEKQLSAMNVGYQKLLDELWECLFPSISALIWTDPKIGEAEYPVISWVNIKDTDGCDNCYLPRWSTCWGRVCQVSPPT